MAGAPPGRESGGFRGVVLGRIGGIEITVHGSWLVWLGLLVMVAWRFWVPEIAPRATPVVAAVIACLMVLPLAASILVHELAHSVVARAYGLRVRRITLFMFGGVAQIERVAPGPAAEFRIALAGPLSSLLLASVFALVARLQYPEYEGVPGPWGTLATFNLVLAVFNLLPAYPMDGGRILRSALWGGWRSLPRATRWSVAIGKVLSGGVIVLGLVLVVLAQMGSRAGSAEDLWLMVLGVFLFNAAGAAGAAESGDADDGTVQ